VYDVSNFLDEHPGGKKILQRVLGQDASKQFWKYHNEKVMAKWGTPLKIGSIGSSDTTPKPAAVKPAVPTKYSPPRPKPQPTLQIPTPSTDNKSAPEIFGEVLPSHFARPIDPQLIPFAEPAWYTGLASPYYNASHHRLRKFMRPYMDANIIPHVFDWEEKKAQPKELFKQVAEQGFIAAAQFPLPPKEYMQGVTLPGGIKVPSLITGYSGVIVV
jgi:hypothetical protein